ncbi:hypothetical protein L7F22_060185 [Adiantum nelumboides]|nr:hypothetical protein [Adiantum nelumboides]
MKTRQHNIPSEYEESEEAERLDSESSDDSGYAPASQENSSEDNDQPQEASPSTTRGTGATDKISTSEIPCPSNALSDNPIQVVFHLNPPKHALSEVFSPQQLSQLGLQSLAQVDLMSNMVTPAKLGAMLLTFPKLNNKILYVEHLGRAMGIKNMSIPLPTSKTYSRLTPRETADACDELLSASHLDFQRNLKIFHILHYYFLMRFPVVNSLSLPSPRLYDMFFCLCHSLPYPFHVTMFKAIQNRTKRFKTQRKGKAEKFHCYAAPIMQWMAQLISESDTPGSSQPPATDKGKRALLGRGVQTRGGHSKRTKVSRDSAADLSSVPFSQSHHTGSIRTQTSSLISPTPIIAPAGRTIISSAPQTTPQMTSPIGTVGPAPSTIVHQTGLTAATTISMEPSTSTPTLRTFAPQGITHFMSRADKLLQMERSATLTIGDAINTIHGAQKMHAVTYESMYEELLDTHQRVYDCDVEKAALFDRNRILNRQVQDLKEVISSLNLQLREAQEQLQQKSVVTTMVCERCAQMELTVTTTTPVAPISLPIEEIPTTYSGGVSLASHTLTGSHEQTEVFTSMPLPPHGVLPCPLPGRPYVGTSTFAPSMPATPFVSSAAPIQPHPNIYSPHFGTLPQYHMQLPTPHQLPSPSQALVSSSVSIQPNPALYSSHFGTLPGNHMAIPPPSHLPSPSQVQPAYSLYPNLGFNPYNPLPYNYPPAPYPFFYAPPQTQSSSQFYPPPPPPSSSSEASIASSTINILYIPLILFCLLYIHSPGRPGLWVYSIVWLLLNVDGWESNIIFTAMPLILILAIGTKLQHIITKMAIHFNDRNALTVGMPNVEPNDKLFWFHRPRFILYCIHFILFQNALEISFDVWAAITFPPDNCIYRQPGLLLGRISIGLAVLMLCGLVTLPIYALVSQMGSNVKRAIFEEHIQLAVRRWHKQAKATIRTPQDVGESSSRSSHASEILEDDPPQVDAYPIEMADYGVQPQRTAES